LSCLNNPHYLISPTISHSIRVRPVSIVNRLWAEYRG